MRPDFLIIGAMKAGTTSLYEELRAHPQIFMAVPKELHFFVQGRNWERGVAWYESCFAGAAGYSAVGEASPSYSQADVFRGVPERIASVLPGVRLVYLLRDPIERMRSMYVHQVAAGREQRPIDVALRTDGHYLASSRYAWQLEQHLRHVPLERIHVLTGEDLRARRVPTLAALAGFLGADPSRLPAAAPAERGRAVDRRSRRPVVQRLAATMPYRIVGRRMPASVKRAARTLTTMPVDLADASVPDRLASELADRLRPDVARLRELLGPDAPSWGLLDEPPSRASP